MGQISVFRVNLNNIEGDGEFTCPSCGAMISPDDESEEAYEIIDVKTKKDGSLGTLSIRCRKCGSTIRLEGFEALDNLNETGRSDDS